jgi:hypothetical protein
MRDAAEPKVIDPACEDFPVAIIRLPAEPTIVERAASLAGNESSVTIDLEYDLHGAMVL